MAVNKIKQDKKVFLSQDDGLQKLARQGRGRFYKLSDGAYVRREICSDRISFVGVVGVAQVTPMKYFSTRGGEDLLTFEEVNRFPF